tara:strand:+ start:1869 stop:4049 length:2181 start_codon:yes stop_codon:yes gene_type:complete
MARKSLGTLTLDLIAKVSGFEQGMDKAARKSQKTAKQIERYSNQIGAALTVGTAAAVSGMAALVASTAEGAREVKNLSALAGATPQQFQKLTYAAKRYGIEQDKVADILKDTNDRIGDFIQTGGGPMADFFENIAPKVGVTADQFARLSGPEALQLYVSSLEEAGVSQKDMTFYMETIASDATALIPLLRDNGKEMKALGDEAERTGNVFSDMDFEQLESIRRGMDELTGAATGMKNEVVMAALPAINDLIDILSDESTLESARALGGAVVTSMNFVIKAIDGAVKVTQFLAEELAAFVHGPAADDIPRLTEKLQDLNEAMEGQEERLKNLRQTPGLIPPEVLKVEEERLRRIKAEYEAVSQLIDNARKNQSARNGANGSGTGVDTIDLPPSGNNRGGGGAGSNGSSASDLESDLQSRLATIRQAFETEKQTILRVYGERNEEIQALYEADALSKMEADNLKFQNEQQKIESITALTKENLAQREEVEAGYWERWIESASENLQNFDELSKTVIDNFTTGFGNAFESVIFDAESLDDALKGIGETILRSVVNAIGQMAAQWLALQAVQAIMGTSATATTVAQAAAASAAWAPAAAMASLATMGGNAVPAAAALTSTTALSSTLAVVGMAHDGIDSVPKEGTWLLDKGERVLTSETSAKLDATLSRIGQGGSGTVVNVNNAPAGTRTEESTDSQGNRVIDIFIADMSTGGPMSRTIQSTYGLKRQGR